MHRILVVLLFLGAPVGAAFAAEPDGRVLYQQYCLSCHGPSGRGDGPDATIFVVPPRDLHEGFLSRYATDDLVRRLRDGRALELGLDLAALRAHAQGVEDLVAHLKRLPGIDWDLVAPGWERYVDRCELCHGPTGRPGTILPCGVRCPRDLSDPKFQRSMSDKDLITAVRHGRKHMPALTPRVTVDEAKELAKFVRLLSPGFELYSRYCANCHGDDGRGVRAMSERVRLPKVVFDHAYFKAHDSDQLRTSVWHMLADEKPMMPHFRPLLSEAEARAIIEYVKSRDQ